MRFIYEAIFVLFLVSAIPAQNCEQTTALSQNKDGHNDHCPVSMLQIHFILTTICQTNVLTPEINFKKFLFCHKILVEKKTIKI